MSIRAKAIRGSNEIYRATEKVDGYADRLCAILGLANRRDLIGGHGPGNRHGGRHLATSLEQEVEKLFALITLADLLNCSNRERIALLNASIQFDNSCRTYRSISQRGGDANSENGARRTLVNHWNELEPMLGRLNKPSIGNECERVSGVLSNSPRFYRGSGRGGF